MFTKKIHIILLVFCLSTFCSKGQTIESTMQKEELYSRTKNGYEKNQLALDIIEEYTYLSQVERAQNWIYILMDNNFDSNNDTLNYYIKTNQAEIFYWCNLFEFADQPANEALKIAKNLKDSMLISNAAMFVSYVKEMQDSLWESIKYAHYAKLYYPSMISKKYRVMIRKSQIINNFAQVFVKLKNVDSAIYYNRLAFPLAMAEKSERAIIYGYYNYANIHTQLNNVDSALYYYNKSNESAIAFRKFDLLLQNYTSMLDLYPNNSYRQIEIINNCFKLIDTNEIAPLNKGVFYQKAILVLKGHDNDNLLVKLQDDYIKLQDKISNQGKLQVQKISQMFVEKENHFLQLKLQDIYHKRKLNIIQLSSIVFILLVGLIIYYFYSKKRKVELESKLQQQKIIAHERSRIANDIHDDLGTNLSRIRYITYSLPEIQTTEDLQMNYSKIIALSDDSVDKMNEIIWSLKQDDFKIDEFYSYIRKMSAEISEEKNINISYSFVDDMNTLALNAEACRNIYLTVKEALHNAIKHANASLIEINTFINERLVIKVSDNGGGFKDQLQTGNGLHNMYKRMNSINGKLDIETSSNGTVITISSHVL